MSAKNMNGPRVGRCRSGLFTPSRWAPLIAACLLFGGGHPELAGGATLQELFAGATINVGNSGMSDWQLISLDATSGAIPDLSQITVVPLVDDLSNPGLQLFGNGQLSVSGINAIDLLFQFRVHALAGGNSFVNHTLTMTGITFGSDGGITYISDEITNHDGADLGPTLVIADNESDVNQFTSTSTYAPQSGVFVETNVFVTGLSSADSINLSSFSQRFSQTGPAVLAGDYNRKGKVDAADYVVWRNNVGAPAGTLPNDINSGPIGQAQYNTWRSNFGNTSGVASSAAEHAIVPEPATALLTMILMAMASVFRTPRAATMLGVRRGLDRLHLHSLR